MSIVGTLGPPAPKKTPLSYVVTEIAVIEFFY